MLVAYWTMSSSKVLVMSQILLLHPGIKLITEISIHHSAQ